MATVMQKYTDDQGQEWNIELNGWTMKRVRDNAGALLTALFDDDAKLFAELHSDPILLADVVWPLIEDQAKERSVSIRDFATSFSGDVVGRARDAVVEATIDFFDDPARRANSRALIAKMNELAKEISEGAVEDLKGIDVGGVAQGYIDSLDVNCQGGK